MSPIILIVVSVFLGVLGQIFLKQGTLHLNTANSSLAGFFLSAFTNIYVLIGLFLYFISSLIWLLVLSKVDLSFAYPMLAFGYILILLFSYLILHEHINSLRLLGVVLISLGVILITRS